MTEGNSGDPDWLAEIGDVTKAIISFANSPELRELDAFYRRCSTFEILNIHRNETRHSRFLAWLLDPNGSHGLGTFSLNKFIEACVMARIESRQHLPKEVPTELLDQLIVGRVAIDEATVDTEVCFGKNGRIDIHVVCSISGSDISPKRLIVLIENKVNSREHDSQTMKYADWLRENRHKYDYALLVYLTPTPTVKLMAYEDPDCECKDFLQINYQYIVDYLIEPALALLPSGNRRDFLSDYLRALSVPSVIAQSEKKDNKGDVIMAVSEHERNLLTGFWEKHKPLILAALYAISSDPNQDQELRDDADKIVRSGSKDFSTFAVLFDGKVVRRQVKKTALGREIANVLIESGITAEQFIQLKSDRSSSFSLLKTVAEITAAEKEYNRYRESKESPVVFDGTEYYVSGNWGDNNIPKLQDFLKKHFSMIKLEKEHAQ